MRLRRTKTDMRRFFASLLAMVCLLPGCSGQKTEQVPSGSESVSFFESEVSKAGENGRNRNESDISVSETTTEPNDGIPTAKTDIGTETGSEIGTVSDTVRETGNSTEDTSRQTETVKRSDTVSDTQRKSDTTKTAEQTTSLPETEPSEYCLYVDPIHGSDTAKGDLNSPLKTLESAQRTARTYAVHGDGDVTVYLHGGTYRINSTLHFTAQDGGKNGYTVTYTAYPGETPILSGGKPIANWHVYDQNQGIYVADIGAGNTGDLFVNGTRAVLARTEPLNVQSADSTSFVVFSGQLDASAVSDSLRIVVNQAGGQARISISSASTSASGVKLTVRESARQTYASCRSTDSSLSQARLYAENRLSFLDCAGEWYLDSAQGKIYYKPKAGESMTDTCAVLGTSETLLTVEGSAENPVKALVFDSLTLTETAERSCLTENGGMVQSGNRYVTGSGTEESLSAAVYCRFCDGVVFRNNTFTGLSGTAVWMERGIKNCLVTGNRLTDCGGCGIVLSSFEDSYHHAVTGKNAEQNRFLLTENTVLEKNLIDGIGTVYQGSVGIEIGYAAGITVQNNELKNLPFSGICLGYGGGFDAEEMSGTYDSDSNGTFSLTGCFITRNRIERVLTVLSGGGAVSVQGKNPNCRITYNVISEVSHDFGAINLGDGAQGFTVTENVIYGAERNFTYRGDYNEIYHNYASTANQPDYDLRQPLVAGQYHYRIAENDVRDTAAVREINRQAGIS